VLSVPVSQGIAGVVRAQVIKAARDGGSVVVLLPDARQMECVVLSTGNGARLGLAEGDRVLVNWEEEGGLGVVLGRIDWPTIESGSSAEPKVEDILLEAGKSITLRVGDGSITIRADGKILIKGKDLVSHAQRTNRIKGGSVAIN
jgi:hypothetical protein